MLFDDSERFSIITVKSEKLLDKSESSFDDLFTLVIILFILFLFILIISSKVPAEFFKSVTVDEKFVIVDWIWSFAWVFKTEFKLIKTESALTTIDSIFSCKGESLSLTSSVKPGAIEEFKVSPLFAISFPYFGITAKAFPPIRPVSYIWAVLWLEKLKSFSTLNFNKSFDELLKNLISWTLPTLKPLIVTGVPLLTPSTSS